MYKLGKYHSNDRMSDLICDNYPILLVLGRFGISLGFGDKTVKEVCEENGVHTGTFLVIINLLLTDDDYSLKKDSNISIESLVSYLHNSHSYFLGFRIPAIRAKLIEAMEGTHNDASVAIIRYFDAYAAEVKKHMQYEETTVFPYVKNLLEEKQQSDYNIDIFKKQHDQIEARLKELKYIIIKYYPSQSTNELNSVLFDIFSCEKDLALHNNIEDNLLIPAIMQFEKRIAGNK